MKLIVAIINDDDGNEVMDELNAAGYSVTKLFSSGGFLKSGNTTLLMCVDELRVDDVLEIIGKKCKSRRTGKGSFENPTQGNAEEIIVGGATVFVSDVERFERM